jgi:2'-5' RNA ligase
MRGRRDRKRPPRRHDASERRDAPVQGSAPSPSIRVFVGIPLPEELAVEYVAAQQALAGLRNVKWVERGNLHLTLKFLGRVDRTAVSPLAEALARAALRSTPAVLGPGTVTAFPSDRSARVLVVELIDATGAVGRLQAEVERELAALGHSPDDRGFRTHVTIGRVREGKAEARVDLAGVPAPRSSWPVEAFELIESRLGPRGPTYSPLESFQLGRGKSG